REVDVGLEFLQPQRLPHRQEVPVILVSGDRPGERSTYTHECLSLLANGSLEGIASDVDHLGPVEGTTPGTKPAGEADTSAKYIFQFLYRTAEGSLPE